MDATSISIFASYVPSLIARLLDIPYEQGLAHLEIGTHISVQYPQRRVHLEQAEKLFSEIGATYQYDRVSQFLNTE